MEDMFIEKSKVYFTDFRTCVGVSLTEKLQRLIKKAGITDIDMDGKYYNLLRMVSLHIP